MKSTKSCIKTRKKLYKIIPTKKQLSIMKLYWSMFQVEENTFWGKIGNLEKSMSAATKIPGLEFFQSDGDWCGIGQADREMKLIQQEGLK
jgi:hypothetical protein